MKKLDSKVSGLHRYLVHTDATGERYATGERRGQAAVAETMRRAAPRIPA